MRKCSRYYPVANPVNELCDLTIKVGIAVMGNLTESEKEFLHDSIVEAGNPFECPREVKMEGLHNDRHQVMIVTPSLPEGS